MIEFQGSSFFRMCARVQSNVVNIPPHTAKLPPMIGARSLTASSEPSRRRFMPCSTQRHSEKEDFTMRPDSERTERNLRSVRSEIRERPGRLNLRLLPSRRRRRSRLRYATGCKNTTRELGFEKKKNPRFDDFDRTLYSPWLTCVFFHVPRNQTRGFRD
jgi:hypothetical protein